MHHSAPRRSRNPAPPCRVITGKRMPRVALEKKAHFSCGSGVDLRSCDVICRTADLLTAPLAEGREGYWHIHVLPRCRGQSRNAVLISMPEIPHPEQILIAMSRLSGGTSRPLEYEDIVVQAWRLFPEDFGLRKYVREPLPGKPDFVFRAEKVVVFVDGCFWHGCPRHGRMPASRIEYRGAEAGAELAARPDRNTRLARIGLDGFARLGVRLGTFARPAHVGTYRSRCHRCTPRAIASKSRAGVIITITVLLEVLLRYAWDAPKSASPQLEPLPCLYLRSPGGSDAAALAS